MACRELLCIVMDMSCTQHGPLLPHIVSMCAGIGGVFMLVVCPV